LTKRLVPIKFWKPQARLRHYDTGNIVDIGPTYYSKPGIQLLIFGPGPKKVSILRFTSYFSFILLHSNVFVFLQGSAVKTCVLNFFLS
jgi:hypothetical protein